MSNLPINPWLMIWTKPKEVIRTLVNSDVRFRFFIMCMLYGLPIALQMNQAYSLGKVMPLVPLVVISLALSPIFGVIGIYYSSAFLFWLGKLLGGKAQFLEIRCAVAWANITNIASILVWGISIAKCGITAFYYEFPYRMPYIWSIASSVLFAIAGIWGIVMLIYMLSEIQKFSTWKAIANLALAFLVSLGGLWLLSKGAVWISNMQV